jgi:hypothetical protein
VRDYGAFRGVKWRDEDSDLVPYQSVDWYVYNAMDESRMQVDAGRLLQSFSDEPWRDEDMLGDHYDLFVIEEDLFDPADEEGPEEAAGYSVGRNLEYTAAVISTHRLDHIWGMPYCYLKTEVMRQLCFMFGIPGPARGDVIEDGDRRYCKNVCILRPAHRAPEDWQTLSEDRIREGALCDSCLSELREFFAGFATEEA